MWLALLIPILLLRTRRLTDAELCSWSPLARGRAESKLGLSDLNHVLVAVPGCFRDQQQTAAKGFPGMGSVLSPGQTQAAGCRRYLPEAVALWVGSDTLQSPSDLTEKGLIMWVYFMGLKEITVWNWLGTFF